MHLRLAQMCAVLVVLAGAFAGVARALDFDDEDPNPPHPEIGLVYEYEIGTHAGCLPHHLVILSGQLPPGLSLRQVNDHTGVVEGMATEEGTFSAWIAVRDCENRSAETLFTFTVWARRFAIATDSLPGATVGSPYSATLQTSGIPSNTTWTVGAGSLPAGLTLSKEGVISGTATAAGSATFEVTATGVAKDFTGTRIHSKQFTLAVTGPLSARLSASKAEVGIPVRSTLIATGGTAPYTWSGSGPTWLQVRSDGALSGTPTRAGSYVVTAHLVDANGSKRDVQVPLVVRPRLAFATRALPAASAGRPYRARLAVRGGVTPLRWSGTLPRELKVDAAHASVTGIAPAAGKYRVTLRVRDALGALSTKTFVLAVR